MANKKQKSIIVVLLALIPVFFGSKFFNSLGLSNSSDTSAGISELYQSRTSGVMVQFEGLIVKILPDDNKGSRHQRFIVELDDQHSLLIAHNIDLAPRVPIKRHQMVTIYGQYEWNEKGGVVHWTHADAKGLHEGGWIEYHGKRYQ